jgi:NADPH:quinone reductase
VLADLAEPRPGPGEALVTVEAIGINFPDLLITQGRYQLMPELPFVPGCEIAGGVDSAPDGSGFRPGDRGAAFTRTGGFAEKAAVPVRAVAGIGPVLSARGGGDGH